MRGETQLLSARSVRWLDVGVVVWMVVWVVLGVLVWQDITAQTQLPSDVIKIGSAVQDTGQALGVVGGAPAGRRHASASSRARSRSWAPRWWRAARPAATASAGSPSSPASPWACCRRPWRSSCTCPCALRWRRSVRSVADALATSSGDPGFEQYLARRAIDALPWDELRAAEPGPVAGRGRRRLPRRWPTPSCGASACGGRSPRARPRRRSPGAAGRSRSAARPARRPRSAAAGGRVRGVRPRPGVPLGWEVRCTGSRAWPGARLGWRSSSSWLLCLPPCRPAWRPAPRRPRTSGSPTSASTPRCCATATCACTRSARSSSAAPSTTSTGTT